MISDYWLNVKHLFALVTLEPIGVSPFVSLITGDADFLITSAAGHYHLVGDYSVIVDGVHYFVIHLVYLVVLSLTH
jgi:hypothetical protein